MDAKKIAIQIANQNADLIEQSNGTRAIGPLAIEEILVPHIEASGKASEKLRDQYAELRQKAGGNFTMSHGQVVALVSRNKEKADAYAGLVEALANLVADWERVHGPMPEDHEAKAALAAAKEGKPV